MESPRLMAESMKEELLEEEELAALKESMSCWSEKWFLVFSFFKQTVGLTQGSFISGI